MRGLFWPRPPVGSDGTCQAAGSSGFRVLRKVVCPKKVVSGNALIGVEDPPPGAARRTGCTQESSRHSTGITRLTKEVDFVSVRRIILNQGKVVLCWTCWLQLEIRLVWPLIINFTHKSYELGLLMPGYK